MMKTGLLWLAGLAGLLAGASLATHRRRERDRVASPTRPEPLTRWEGEGGAVPTPASGELRSARQTTPQPQGGL
jgi:hypothetical protein